MRRYRGAAGWSCEDAHEYRRDSRGCRRFPSRGQNRISESEQQHIMIRPAPHDNTDPLVGDVCAYPSVRSLEPAPQGYGVIRLSPLTPNPPPPPGLRSESAWPPSSSRVPPSRSWRAPAAAPPPTTPTASVRPSTQVLKKHPDPSQVRPQPINPQPQPLTLHQPQPPSWTVPLGGPDAHFREPGNV